MPIFIVFYRVLPVIYCLGVFLLVLNLLSSACFGNLTIKSFFGRLMVSLVWPLTMLSPEGRKKLNKTIRRL